MAPVDAQHQSRYRDGDDEDGTEQASSSTASGSQTRPNTTSVGIIAPTPDLLVPSSANASPMPSRPTSPVPSRSSSPLPLHYGGDASSSYTSDVDDSEPSSPLLHSSRTLRTPWWRDNTPRWWSGGQNGDPRRRRRKLRREPCFGVRRIRRWGRRLIRMRFFPRHPTSILLSLLALTVIAILVTLLLMHILNPDKASLPWRAYCSVPRRSTTPPSIYLSATDENFTLELPYGLDPTDTGAANYTTPFPPPHFDDLPPAGVFLGVFSTDSGGERRMFIRNTWASHPRSRNGADPGDDGNGTSRTIVRFILGKPRADWERRVQLEMDMYNDIVILPVDENMNKGKSQAFFIWAAENAWVPSPSTSSTLSYSTNTTQPPPLAPHDPQFSSTSLSPWVRPDFVIKADDDSFVMLAELEGRLRVELDNALQSQSTNSIVANFHTPSFSGPILDRRTADATLSSNTTHSGDPLIYWGYLVKNRFMAGELYALSYALTRWAATEPSLKSITRGAEDKQTAKWMRLHPRADEIRWASERCWIYDHPRAGTVYSHGFLFPSEVSRVKKRILEFLRPIQVTLSSPGSPAGVKSVLTNPWKTQDTDTPTSTFTSPISPESRFSFAMDDAGQHPDGKVLYALPTTDSPVTPSYSYSSVTRFGTHYRFPLPSLTSSESIEALVEGSHMSHLFEGAPETAKQAWARREGRKTRYEGKRLGGTVVVHFIKRNEWFLEAAVALLGGSEDPDPAKEGRRPVVAVEL